MVPVNCSFASMPLPGPHLHWADHLVSSVTQLLQASFWKEEIPQVSILSLRHRGDDGFFVAFLTKTATQWIHRLYPPAEERPLKLPVSLSNRRYRWLPRVLSYGSYGSPVVKHGPGPPGFAFIGVCLLFTTSRCPSAGCFKFCCNGTSTILIRRGRLLG